MYFGYEVLHFLSKLRFHSKEKYGNDMKQRNDKKA